MGNTRKNVFTIDLAQKQIIRLVNSLDKKIWIPKGRYPELKILKVLGSAPELKWPPNQAIPPLFNYQELKI